MFWELIQVTQQALVWSNVLTKFGFESESEDFNSFFDRKQQKLLKEKGSATGAALTTEL